MVSIKGIDEYSGGTPVDSVLNKVTKYIEKNKLFAVGDTVIVAVSGGADSVALLDVLVNVKELDLRLIVAHVNHLLRGEESAADADFVRNLALHYRLPFELHNVDVHEISIREKLSLETAGRMVRYAWFDEVAAGFRANCIALAHHADDQAETVLMRLLRGSGTTGLAGIPHKSAGRYVRPLLGCTRKEIEKYLAARNISYRTDSTNNDMHFLRNRIRHEFLPYLETFNPSIKDRLASTAEILAADEILLEDICKKAFCRLATVTTGDVTFALPALQAELRGLRYRVYRRAILIIKGNLAHITFRHLWNIDELLFSLKSNAEISLPGGLTVTKNYRDLSFALSGKDRHNEPYELLIEGPGTFLLPGGNALSVKVSSSPEDWKSVPVTRAYFDLGSAPFPWLVRTFKDGDRIVPFGMTGSKKVKDLFIDMKIPVRARRRIPLVFCNEKLIWVCGVRVAANARISADTETVASADIIEFTL
jgi:tRNA(Ile)-lysidine synthase